MSTISRLRRQPPGRFIVVIGAITGVAAFALTLSFWNVYSALTAALGAAFLMMVVLGTGERFWANKKVQQTQAPGGAGVSFGQEDVEDLKKTLGELNQRVTDQMADVNKRLYDLEAAAFKDAGSQPDPPE